jgi:hypothetical protein
LLVEPVKPIGQIHTGSGRVEGGAVAGIIGARLWLDANHRGIRAVGLIKSGRHQDIADARVGIRTESNLPDLDAKQIGTSGRVIAVNKAMAQTRPDIVTIGRILVILFRRVYPESGSHERVAVVIAGVEQHDHRIGNAGGQVQGIVDGGGYRIKARAIIGDAQPVRPGHHGVAGVNKDMAAIIGVVEVLKLAKIAAVGRARQLAHVDRKTGEVIDRGIHPPVGRGGNFVVIAGI